MYTVLVIKSQDPGTNLPAICFDEGGRRPFLTAELIVAQQYAVVLREMFPGADYKVAKVDV